PSGINRPLGTPAAACPPRLSSLEPCASAAPSTQSPAAPSWQIPLPAPEMHAESPWFPLLSRLHAHFAPLDPLQKRPRQLPLAGMVFAMHRAEVKKLITQRIPLFVLVQNPLQRHGQLSQPRRLRPEILFFLAAPLASQVLVL